MAPHKEVSSFFDLAYNSVAKLVINTCMKIDSTYNFNEAKWQEEVNNLQELLVGSISPFHWDLLCDEVFSLVNIEGFRDFRVLYATLAHKNMKKLKICHYTRSNFYFSNEHDSAFESNRDFWVGLIPKLVNLVELNTKWIECPDLFRAVNDNCVKLERLSYYNETNPNFFDLLLNCKQLRFIKNYSCLPVYNPFGENKYTVAQAKQALISFPNLEEFECEFMVDVFNDFDVVGPLNLRSYRQRDQYDFFTPQDLDIVVLLCPLLQSLDVEINDREGCKEIFEVLAGSNLRLETFNISNFYFVDSAKNFFKVNRESIKNLDFTSRDPNLYTGVLCIGKYCKNLTSLKISDYRESCNYVNNSNLVLPESEMLFKNLRRLTYSPNDDWTGTWNIAFLCLSNSSQVSSFSIIHTCGSDEPLKRLFNSKWMTQLSRFKVSLFLSMSVLRHIYDRCPNLKYVKLGNGIDDLDQLTLLRLDVEEKNLDLTIKY